MLFILLIILTQAHFRLDIPTYGIIMESDKKLKLPITKCKIDISIFIETIHKYLQRKLCLSPEVPSLTTERNL